MVVSRWDCSDAAVAGNLRDRYSINGLNKAAALVPMGKAQQNAEGIQAFGGRSRPASGAA